MQVSEAVKRRMSCRAFLPDPVPRRVVEEILDIARWAPSGSNLQPWRVHVLAGARLEALKALLRGRRDELPRGEGADYVVTPPDLPEDYRQRRFRCGAMLYESIGIAREAKAARLAQFAQNFECFGAPCAMFFAVDRTMGPGQWADVGMFVQTVMLLAAERDLATCAQQSWANFPRTLAAFLPLPETQILYTGLALGRMDEAHPINRWRTERAAVADFAVLEGFD